MVNTANFMDDKTYETIRSLVAHCGGDPESFEGELIGQQIESSLKLIHDGHDTGQLKLITRSLKEMRYAYRVFNKYAGSPRVSIFGSARTPEDHPDYIAARSFSTQLAAKGWMCITGAADGIMKAGLEGLHPESSFGLSIRLPFESATKAFIEGDPKHITFRYFFTRKLMFVSHSEAVAVFPGGFGTMDELFETLTLMQTGKANIIPVVLLQGGNGEYWQHWKDYVEEHLLGNGWISPEDESFFFMPKTPEEAVEHILQFYKRYHSSRYVKDMLVLRLNEALTDEQIEILNQEFSKVVEKGKIERVATYPEESDHVDLPRIAFHHNRFHFGLIRQLIDRINSF